MSASPEEEAMRLVRKHRFSVLWDAQTEKFLAINSADIVVSGATDVDPARAVLKLMEVLEL